LWRVGCGMGERIRAGKLVLLTGTTALCWGLA
jgi:hypothetical protein